MKQNSLHYVMRETGLARCPAFYLDYQFHLALLGGGIVLLAMYIWISPQPGVSHDGLTNIVVSLILWQPFIEELLFRGILQGQLIRAPWGRRSMLAVTQANLLTSVVFILFHFVHHSPLWALSIFVPSLVFGYFRERHDSLYPPLALHSLYNLGYVLVFVG